ncbi:MAG: F0F1 ATP synthase subunit A [Rhodospirillaceae bacterium]|nr:F0F1 ATP synthase subunit A [Rhodospirillaceae bacterium]MBT4589479.1 F0F1 ATP synthase subunit A [Rhodospirillaceae bacterium]MBT4939157.1 F0F1 ATP synthase subunit A [Rhodospirillaceae bacterium]MBT7268251.1 F0F1 ATP synthase subunit A [Rhodospirillaceae bacterium]
MAEAHNPLEQFIIKTWVPIKIGDFDASFTNSSAFMLLAVIAATALMVFAVRPRAGVPGRWQLLAELSYQFIAKMVSDNIGKEGRPYFPFIFSIFMFVLFGNFIGMVPYTFTFTSHIAVTLSMALVIFIMVTVIAFVKHGFHFFSFFLPAGVPIVLAPLMIAIEVISYFTRPFSLSVRLFANMMAGHTLLKVIGGFVVPLGIFGVVPIAGLVAVTGLEFLIAFLQAYIFTILTCIYINDAIHLH